MLEKKFVRMYIIYEPMPYGRRKTKRRAYPKYRRSTGKKTGRKAYRTRPKRSGTYKKVVSLRPKWINPLSQTEYVRFIYADSGFSRTLTAANGYSSYYVFRGNSPYDPDYTGVGVQPYGWDQHAGADLYTNFAAKSSSIKVYFQIEPDYANLRRLHAFIIPLRQVAPLLTDISDVRMIPGAIETTYDGETESTRGAKMKHYMSTRRLFRESSSVDVSMAGTYSANPSTQWFWIVHFYTDQVTEDLVVNFDVKIKFYTVLTRTSQPDES